jgi:hypothetical protein
MIPEIDSNDPKSSSNDGDLNPMFVNITRSKLLINSNKPVRKIKKPSAKSVRCNHCGGPVRPNGDIQTCLMCSRDISHLCANCSSPREDVEKEKQIA